MNCLENKNPYDLTDKAIDLLNRRAVKRFEDAKDEAALAKFDELNVLEVTRTLYDQLRKDNQDVFLELAQERYQEAEPHGKEPPDLAWLLALLRNTSIPTNGSASVTAQRRLLTRPPQRSQSFDGAFPTGRR